MHGRPRKPPTPEEEKAYDVKAAKLRSLQPQLLHFHHNHIYTKESLEACAKLVEANPDYMTAWNYRKLAVEHIVSQLESNSESDPDAVKAIFKEELKVTERALSTNYKSYGAWYHRKWVLRKGHSSIDRELQLLQVFLKQDTRNFHAWNYRRFVAALKNRSDEEELQFTTDMIDDNFSNYSAWHNRSSILSQLLEKKVEGYFPKEKILTEEYDLVHQALFTNPDDQSGWFYHHWLLSETVKTEAPLLVYTWPPPGSNLKVWVDRCLDVSLPSSPVTSFHLKTGQIPVVLFFSEAVEGVNSSTITMESSMHDTSTELIWSPLSTNNSGRAQAWMTQLSFPEEKFHFSQANGIKVTIGHCEGIKSISGFTLSHPTYFEFVVYLQSTAPHHADLQSLGMLSWGDENFHTYEVHPKESSQIKLSDPLKSCDDNGSMAYNWNAETITTEIALFRELLSLSDTDCKIGKLTLARLLTALDETTSHDKTLDSKKVVHFGEVLELYSDLMKLDPPHSQFYKDEYSLVLLQQLTSDPESLLRHCYNYRDPSPSRNICLRLCNLSLSRIGSVKQLLWIQMLDLSHNQLRSIEGLEAMQLLSCLNLSCNKFGSFSALEPLKQLQSLRALNISYNEIGAHPVNTSRYLCSSPLSHIVGSDWNFGEFATDVTDFTNYWEAFSIFKDLKLTQLEIIGNVVAEENIKLFLVKVMPSLRWLDGVELQ